MPHPCTGADRKAGYRYQVSVMTGPFYAGLSLQAEFSLTQVLDRPVTGPRVL